MEFYGYLIIYLKETDFYLINNNNFYRKKMSSKKYIKIYIF